MNGTNRPAGTPSSAPVGTDEKTVGVERAVALIRAGGVVAYPTEAVFGLGCDPANPAALERILRIKGRAAEKGFILVAADARQLLPWLAPLEPAWRSRMESAWPGPVTFVVPASERPVALLRGGRTTIAVRVSAHPVVRALCEGAAHPLVSTSANASGRPALTDARAVAHEFGIGEGGVDAIVAGETGGRGSPSTIIDVRTGERLR